MRLDKYLKLSRLIKRRTVACDACDTDRVEVNGKPAKPSYRVKVGDVVSVSFGAKQVKIRVLSISEHTTKDSASLMYEEIAE